MDVVNLPSTLPDNLDLQTLNRLLLSSEVTLDWSNVERASLDALSTLLTGLDLVEYSEQLGLATIPEPLVEGTKWR